MKKQFTFIFLSTLLCSSINASSSSSSSSSNSNGLEMLSLAAEIIHADPSLISHDQFEINAHQNALRLIDQIERATQSCDYFDKDLIDRVISAALPKDTVKIFKTLISKFDENKISEKDMDLFSGWSTLNNEIFNIFYRRPSENKFLSTLSYRAIDTEYSILTKSIQKKEKFSKKVEEGMKYTVFKDLITTRLRSLLWLNLLRNYPSDIESKYIIYAFTDACVSGNIPLAQMLMNHEILGDKAVTQTMINKPFQYEDEKKASTVLIRAACNGCTRMISFLLNSGADINQVDDHSSSPLLWAIYHGKTDTAKFLIKKEANLDSLNQDGLGAFHFAAMTHNIELLDILLQKTPGNVNLQDFKYGSTPLMWAMTPEIKTPNWEERTQKTIEFLVSRGANLTIKNNENYIAADLAVQYLSSYSKLITLLSNNNSKTLSPKMQKIVENSFKDQTSQNSAINQTPSNKRPKEKTTTTATLHMTKEKSSSGSSQVITHTSTVTITTPPETISSLEEIQTVGNKRKIPEIIDLTGDSE